VDKGSELPSPEELYIASSMGTAVLGMTFVQYGQEILDASSAKKNRAAHFESWVPVEISTYGGRYL